jgi:hypothetical protein
MGRASTDDDIGSDRVSLHMSILHLFEELENLHPLPAFLASTDGSPVGNSVSPYAFARHPVNSLQSFKGLEGTWCL